MIFIEVGRESVVDTLVIGIEPADFLGQHLFDDDRREVDGAEREGIELQERTELAFHVGCDK